MRDQVLILGWHAKAGHGRASLVFDDPKPFPGDEAGMLALPLHGEGIDLLVFNLVLGQLFHFGGSVQDPIGYRLRAIGYLLVRDSRRPWKDFPAIGRWDGVTRPRQHVVVAVDGHVSARRVGGIQHVVVAGPHMLCAGVKCR